jgi:hypothetical protein
MSDLYVEKVLGWKPRPLDPRTPYWKSITEAERKRATTYCGPHESYPLGPGCEHVKAAWILAMSGHGSPNISCIKRYATAHGCYIPPSHKGLEDWQKGI